VISYQKNKHRSPPSILKSKTLHSKINLLNYTYGTLQDNKNIDPSYLHTSRAATEYSWYSIYPGRDLLKISKNNGMIYARQKQIKLLFYSLVIKAIYKRESVKHK
jgi:hypothetical protein